MESSDRSEGVVPRRSFGKTQEHGWTAKDHREKNSGVNWSKLSSQIMVINQWQQKTKKVLVETMFRPYLASVATFQRCLRPNVGTTCNFIIHISLVSQFDEGLWQQWPLPSTEICFWRITVTIRFPNLTRAYDNNGRRPRQKFVFGILQLFAVFIIASDINVSTVS